MGWTDIFKSKASSSQTDGRVHWFGKLPTYPDYYTSPTDDEWCHEFNDWILKGFEIYKSRADHAGHGRALLPLSVCVVRLANSPMTVLSAILDFGGDMRGRPFPMCFYVGVPTEALMGPTDGTSSGLMVTLERLLSMRRDVSRFLNSPGKFEHTFGERELDLSWLEAGKGDDGWVRPARELTFGSWFGGMRDALPIKEEDTWLRQVARRGESIKTLASSSFEATLRFPINGTLPVVTQVAGWLRWLGSRVALQKRTFSLFLTNSWDRSAGWLALVLRPMLDEDFVLMTPACKTLGYVDDVDGGAVDGGGPSEVATPERWIDFVTGNDNSA